MTVLVERSLEDKFYLLLFVLTNYVSEAVFGLQKRH